MEKLHRQIVEGRDRPDAVSIIPFVPVDKSYGIVVLREFRPVLGGYEISFPAGLLDANETVEQCAARELREESGLTLTEVISCSPLVFSSAGLSNECLHNVFCMAEGVPTNQHAEAEEDIQPLLLTFDQLPDLVWSRGQYSDIRHGARTWPVLMMLAGMWQVMGASAILECIRSSKK